jgi:hypothetical protein
MLDPTSTFRQDLITVNQRADRQMEHIAGPSVPDLLAAHDHETAAPGNTKVNKTALGSESSLASLLSLWYSRPLTFCGKPAYPCRRSGPVLLRGFSHRVAAGAARNDGMKREVPPSLICYADRPNR